MTWTVCYGLRGRSSRRFDSYAEALYFTRSKLAEAYQPDHVVRLMETWRWQAERPAAE